MLVRTRPAAPYPGAPQEHTNETRPASGRVRCLPALTIELTVRTRAEHTAVPTGRLPCERVVPPGTDADSPVHGRLSQIVHALSIVREHILRLRERNPPRAVGCHALQHTGAIVTAPVFSTSDHADCHTSRYGTPPAFNVTTTPVEGHSCTLDRRSVMRQ